MLLLTGATGYLGSGIARELARQGRPFRVLVREASRLRFDASATACQVAVADLADGESLGPALEGVTEVIHTAALVKMWVRDAAEFHRVNWGGLQNLLRAAAAAGVSRIVYTSSFMALGPSRDPSAGEGRAHRGPFANEYERTKVQALEWLRAEGFGQYPVIALLPGVIYGPGPRTEGNLVGRMIGQYLAGQFPGLLGSGEQRWSFAYREDVVAAHLAALERGQRGQEYVVAGDNRSLNDLFRLVGEISKVRRPVRHIPFWVGAIGGGVELARARLFGRPPQLTPGVVKIFKHDWVYSSAKAVAELGYRVRPLEDGLARTLAVARNGWPVDHAGTNA